MKTQLNLKTPTDALAYTLAQALERLLTVTLDAMENEGYTLSKVEQQASDQARAALAIYWGNK